MNLMFIQFITNRHAGPHKKRYRTGSVDLSRSTPASVKVRLAEYQERGKLIAELRRVYVSGENGPTIRYDVISGAREQHGLPATELCTLLNRIGVTFPLSSNLATVTDGKLHISAFPIKYNPFHAVATFVIGSAFSVRRAVRRPSAHALR